MVSSALYRYFPSRDELLTALIIDAYDALGFGMISFELFGQLVGSVDPADEFFSYAVEQMADFAGLPAASGT